MLLAPAHSPLAPSAALVGDAARVGITAADKIHPGDAMGGFRPGLERQGRQGGQEQRFGACPVVDLDQAARSPAAADRRPARRSTGRVLPRRGALPSETVGRGQ